MHMGLSGINVAWLQSNEACYGEFIILPEAGLAFSQHRPDNITTIQYATADFDKKRRDFFLYWPPLSD